MKTFKYDDQDYNIAPVTAKERQEAKSVYRRAFFKALEDGAFLQANALDVAKQCGLWSEKKDQELQELQIELEALLTKLEEGGYEFNEAVEDAVKAGEIRNKIFMINLTITDLLSHSAERQAETAEADYILWASLKKGKQKVYKTFDEFLTAKDDNDPLIYAAVSQDMNLSNEFYKELPENKFLIEYGRMSEDLEVLDEEGNPVVAEPEPEPEKKETKPFIGAPPKKEPPQEEPVEPEAVPEEPVEAS